MKKLKNNKIELNNIKELIDFSNKVITSIYEDDKKNVRYNKDNKDKILTKNVISSILTFNSSYGVFKGKNLNGGYFGILTEKLSSLQEENINKNYIPKIFSEEFKELGDKVFLELENKDKEKLSDIETSIMEYVLKSINSDIYEKLSRDAGIISSMLKTKDFVDKFLSLKGKDRLDRLGYYINEFLDSINKINELETSCINEFVYKDKFNIEKNLHISDLDYEEIKTLDKLIFLNYIKLSYCNMINIIINFNSLAEQNNLKKSMDGK